MAMVSELGDAALLLRRQVFSRLDVLLEWWHKHLGKHLELNPRVPDRYCKLSGLQFAKAWSVESQASSGK